MKKNILFLLLVFSYSAFCQMITTPNIPYGITQDFDQIDDTVAVSNSGPWDFSNIQPTSSYQVNVFSIDSSSNKSSYPNATHVLQSANGEFFMNVMPMGNFYHGKLSSTTTTNYSVPLKLVPYPLTANTNHSHNISSTIVWNTLTMNFTDKSEIQGISSGTVTMPDGKSYANALLVNSKRTQVTGPSLFGNYVTVEEISKQIYLQDYPYPVVEILHVFSNGTLQFKRSLFMQENLTFSNSETDLYQISPYPNPFNDHITIDIKDQSKVSIFSVDGKKMVSKNNMQPGQNIISLKGFPQGSYVLHIENSKGILSREIIVKKNNI